MNDTVSAIVVVKGNPPFLKETLRSVKDFASEILIADIGIDKEVIGWLRDTKHVRIVKVDKPVPYVELIREEIKEKSKGDYIMLLDPDESVPPELLALLKENMDSYDYFSIPRKNIIFGKWIEHSRWWPDFQIRFFKRDAVSWPKSIHQQPVTHGHGLTLRADGAIAIVHHNYENIDEYMSKAVRYAKSEASEHIRKETPVTLASSMKRGLGEFVSRYFAAEGYKDGMHGFVLATLQMFYYLLVYFYYWEQQSYKEVPDTEIRDNVRGFFREGLLETNWWSGRSGGSVGSNVKKKIENIILNRMK